MANTVSLNGSTNYSVPAVGESGWGTDLSAYLVAIASNCLAVKGGTFTILADVNFGATYGLKARYFTARDSAGTSIPATAGQVRLAKGDTIGWRNNANGADLSLGITTSDVLQFNSLPLVNIALGSANQVLGVNSGATANEYKTISGTSNQVTVTHGANSITLATPQDIAAASSPTFAGLTLTAFSGVLKATAGVVSAAAVVDADVDAAAGITWSKISKTGSNLTDLDTRSHTDLSDIGTNTHAQIDSHIASTSNPHSVTATQVGLGNVDNTSDATKNAAVATLTNKTLVADSTTIADGTDGTKKFQFAASGITTGTTRTFTMPDADGTLVTSATSVDLNSAQALTNKDLSDATNTFPTASQTVLGLRYSVDAITDQSASSITDNTETDLGAGTITLQPGTYLLSFGARSDITTSADPTFATVIVRVTDSSNTSITSTGGGGLVKYVSGRWLVNFSNMYTYVVASETTIKLRGSIAITGGTVTTRSLLGGHIRAERLP